jgi:hypothetical protein
VSKIGDLVFVAHYTCTSMINETSSNNFVNNVLLLHYNTNSNNNTASNNRNMMHNSKSLIRIVSCIALIPAHFVFVNLTLYHIVLHHFQFWGSLWTLMVLLT